MRSDALFYLPRHHPRRIYHTNNHGEPVSYHVTYPSFESIRLFNYTSHSLSMESNDAASQWDTFPSQLEYDSNQRRWQQTYLPPDAHLTDPLPLTLPGMSLSFSDCLKDTLSDPFTDSRYDSPLSFQPDLTFDTFVMPLGLHHISIRSTLVVSDLPDPLVFSLHIGLSPVDVCFSDPHDPSRFLRLRGLTQMVLLQRGPYFFFCPLYLDGLIRLDQISLAQLRYMKDAYPPFWKEMPARHPLFYFVPGDATHIDASPLVPCSSVYCKCSMLDKLEVLHHPTASYSRPIDFIVWMAHVARLHPSLQWSPSELIDLYAPPSVHIEEIHPDRDEDTELKNLIVELTV